MGFRIKIILAWIFELAGISKWMLKRLNRKYNNNYIRIVNYHDIQSKDLENFREHLKWYSKNFINVNYEQFKQFLSDGKSFGEKPGIMLTFDDGLKGNYDNARKALKENGFTGYFMCSSELIGTVGYMTYDELKNLKKEGHIIGDHTATHHRMKNTDSDDTLNYEIAESKRCLEKELAADIEIFCWCGGEEEYYTRKAFEKIIDCGYKYGFMTNSAPVLEGDNPYLIQRINVEAAWKLYLLRFQVCGFMDWKLSVKRKRVNAKMLGEK